MQRILLIIIAAVLCIFSWWFGARYVLPAPFDAYWLEALYRTKREAAAKADGPRVFLVAGSSAMYGYSSEMMARRIGRPVINFGTHGGTSLEYQLRQVAPSLRAGDTVILAFEHVLYATNAVYDLTAHHAQFYDPGYLAKVAPDQYPSLLFGTRPDLIVRAAGFYRYRDEAVASITPTGDIRGTETDRKDRAVAASVTSDIVARPHAPAVLRTLENFSAWAKAHGITLYATFSPVLDTPDYRRAPFHAWLDSIAALYRERGIPFLGRQEDFFIDRSEIYNTEYHPDATGRARATRVLLAAYCKQAPCRSR